MRLKVFHEGEWHEYPAKTCAGYNYAWEGEPHASVSVRLDGDGNETARNYTPDPRPSNALNSWRTYGTGTSISPVVDMGESAILVQPGTPTQNVLGTMVSIDSQDAGKYVAVAAEVRALDAVLANTMRVLFYNASSTEWYSGGDLNEGEYGRVTGVGITTGGSPQIRFWPTNTTSGREGFLLRKVVIAVADSEEAALAQVETYFDGDTPPIRTWVNFTPRNISGIKRIWHQPNPPPAGTHYAWLGDSHASVSVRLDGDGNEIARNWASNPSFEESSVNMVTSGNGIDRITRTTHYPVSGDWEASAYIQDASSTNATIYQDVPGVKAGQWVAFKAHVQTTDGDKTFRLRLPGFYESVTQWHSSPIVDVPRWFSESGHLFVTQAEYDADFRAYLQFYGPNGGGAPTDGWVRTDAWRIAVADTRQDAVAQVETYFDGSTESDRSHDLWYNSDGVPHEWVNGTNGNPGGWVPRQGV